MDRDLIKWACSVSYVAPRRLWGVGEDRDLVPEKNVDLFDSMEEMMFVWFCQELLSKGYLKVVYLFPITFALSNKQSYTCLKPLKTKVKEVTRGLTGGHVYTPDFLLVWSEKSEGIFYHNLKVASEYKQSPFLAQSFEVKGAEETVSLVEIKPSFTKYNMDKLFYMNQKWLLQRFDLYTNLVRISNKEGSFFDRVFTPERYKLTDAGHRPRKLYYKPKSLEDFMGA